jgi:hypothetical protein
MNEYCGYVVQVEKLRPHTNADRLLIATFFGNDTCVSLDTKIGDVGIYFPTDLQLSQEFCDANNLVRKEDENGKNIGGYLDPNKRNVTTINMRGEKSDGLYLPISVLAYTGIDYKILPIGTHIDEIAGKTICQKYIPAQHYKAPKQHTPAPKKPKVPIAPLFAQHADTMQLAYNLNEFKIGDLVEVTLKIHGTSQRTAYLPRLQGFKRTIWDKIRGKVGTPIYNWGYVTGTRRVTLKNFDNGFYGDNAFREAHSKFFEGKLYKGETVYYEVVGFQTNGDPIMASANNERTKDDAFIKEYGDTTVFSYGCTPAGIKKFYGNDDMGAFIIEMKVPQSDFYVYRMTLTNEDGYTVDYSPDYMRYRCEQMGCKAVPVLWRGIIPEYTEKEITIEQKVDFGEPLRLTRTQMIPTDAGEYIKDIAEQFFDGPDPIGKKHVREGIVARILNKPHFTAFKHKNFYFKCLEGIIKTDADAPDMEEAQEIGDCES